MKIAPLILALGICAAACGDDDKDPATTASTKDYVAIDGQKFCDTLTTCEGADPSFTKEDCIASYGAIRVPPACKAKIDGATCQSASNDVFTADCFPACSQTEAATCDGANFTRCLPSIGKRATVDCNAVCAANSLTFQGCGISPATNSTTCLCQ